MEKSSVVPVPPQTVPEYSASEQPVTRGYRVAFHVWTAGVLLTIIITLVLYLFDKIHHFSTGR